ncbi:MAG: hypothetical protein AAF357_02230 [Verrucomicrobiota bacterium]
MIYEPFAATFPLNPHRGNGDAFGSWVVGKDGWLGFIADAPLSADADSARVAVAEVARWVENGGSDRSVSGDEGRRWLCECLSKVNETMVSRSERCWAAGVLVLVDSEKVHFLGCGDCLAWLCDSTSRRFRYSHSTILGDEGWVDRARLETGEMRVDRIAEGAYLGAEHVTFSEEAVVSCSWRAPARLLLGSDGLEDQLGLPMMAWHLDDKNGKLFSRSSLTESIRARELRDDVTFVGLSLERDWNAGEDEAAVESAAEGPDPNSLEGAEPPVDQNPKQSTFWHGVLRLTRILIALIVSAAVLTLVAIAFWVLFQFYLDERAGRELNLPGVEELEAE